MEELSQYNVQIQHRECLNTTMSAPFTMEILNYKILPVDGVTIVVVTTKTGESS